MYLFLSSLKSFLRRLRSVLKMEMGALPYLQTRKLHSRQTRPHFSSNWYEKKNPLKPIRELTWE